MTTILLVDDERNITELARLYLEAEGYQVYAVYDGASALDFFRATQPDLIVLDLMLPKVDGYKVCRRIRATSDIPVIMLTACILVYQKFTFPSYVANTPGRQYVQIK